MTEIVFIGCPICGKFTPQKVASWKVGDPSEELGFASIRECRGRGKGFVEIDKFPILERFTDFSYLINELCDFSSGVLTHCFLEANLPLNKPYFILKYEQLLHQVNDDDVEASLRFENDDFRQDILKLIKLLKIKQDECEHLGFELDDANRKISEQQQTIQDYEDASLE